MEQQRVPSGIKTHTLPGQSVSDHKRTGRSVRSPEKDIRRNKRVSPEKSYIIREKDQGTSGMHHINSGDVGVGSTPN